MRFEYLDTDTVSDVKYLDSDTNGSNPSKQIWSQIRSENIRTVFIPTNGWQPNKTCWLRREQAMPMGVAVALLAPGQHPLSLTLRPLERAAVHVT